MLGGEGGEGWDESGFGCDRGDDVGRKTESEKSSPVMGEKKTGQFGFKTKEEGSRKKTSDDEPDGVLKQRATDGKSDSSSKQSNKARIRKRKGARISGCGMVV